MSQVKTHSLETKLSALSRLEAGEPATRIAKSIGVTPGAIYYWKQQFPAAKQTVNVAAPRTTTRQTDDLVYKPIAERLALENAILRHKYENQPQA